MKRKHLAVSFLAALLFASCTKQINENDQQLDAQIGTSSSDLTSIEAIQNSPQQTPHDAYVPNELLVKFKKGVATLAQSSAMLRIGGTISEKVLTRAMQAVGDEDGFVIVHTPLAVMDAVSKMRGALGVAFAEPNYIYTHDAVSTDSYFTNGSLWGMYGDASTPKNQYGSQAAEAWGKGHTGSRSVYVGVIDEGIQFTHPDLSGQVWTNPYDPVDGIDNDGNGYRDDVHGWDFASTNNTIYDGGTAGNVDDHGTHVSGTIAAKSNSSGVVGVNWFVTLISCKFLGPNGGTTANAVRAVDYLTDMKTRHGIRIVASNNSWGGGGYSQALYDAIQRANNKSILFVAAAGNGGSDGIGDNIDLSPSYPASYTNSNIIAVAAITSTGGRASFSNYGAQSVDIGAPGAAIWSTTAYNSYSSYSGTSMATPHVTGGVALYASTHTTATAATIKSAILSSAAPTSSLNGKCVSNGRLNVSGF